MVRSRKYWKRFEGHRAFQLGSKEASESSRKSLGKKEWRDEGVKDEGTKGRKSEGVK